MDNSLYAMLASQHQADIVPMRCSAPMLDRLTRHFEDLIADDRHPAVVIQGHCPRGRRKPSLRRMLRINAAAQRQYLFTCDATCVARTWDVPSMPNLTSLPSIDYHAVDTSPFMLIVDARFSGLLASRRIPGGDGDPDAPDREVLWSFDPNVVYTALEYLTARVAAQHPAARSAFERDTRANAPSATSLRLTLNFTTGLAVLLQRQTEMETAMRRISALVNSTFDTQEIIRGAAEHLGRALGARRVSVGLNSDKGVASHAVHEQSPAMKMTADVSESLELFPAPIEVPIAAHGHTLGKVTVEDDTPGRVWEEGELSMLQTVADHLAIGVEHARLFKHVEEQAITDELTGIFNKRYFLDRLDRELQFAERSGAPVSLVLFDLDHLKIINDTHGHLAGDAALRHIGRTVPGVVRTVDVCARYGGEEFAVIMPATDPEHAALVAERIRVAISFNKLPIIGQVTASFGVSTFPGTATTGDELIDEADRALYASKAGGRNCVSAFTPAPPKPVES